MNSMKVLAKYMNSVKVLAKYNVVEWLEENQSYTNSASIQNTYYLSFKEEAIHSYNLGAYVEWTVEKFPTEHAQTDKYFTSASLH